MYQFSKPLQTTKRCPYCNKTKLKSEFYKRSTECKQCGLERKRNSYVSHIERKNYIHSKYKLTQEQWDAMFEKQGRVCAICKTDTPSTKHGWCIDHNHSTMVVRGILCHHCNTAIGYIERYNIPMEVFSAYLQKGK